MFKLVDLPTLGRLSQVCKRFAEICTKYDDVWAHGLKDLWDNANPPPKAYSFLHLPTNCPLQQVCQAAYKNLQLHLSKLIQLMQDGLSSDVWDEIFGLGWFLLHTGCNGPILDSFYAESSVWLEFNGDSIDGLIDDYLNEEGCTLNHLGWSQGYVYGAAPDWKTVCMRRSAVEFFKDMYGKHWEKIQTIDTSDFDHRLRYVQ